MTLRSLVAVLAILVCFATIPAFGQAVSGSILGTITDVTGASVPNAKITITDQNTGFTRSDQTNQSGNFGFPNLPPGTYRLSAELTGFRRAERASIIVDANNTVRVDLALQPGQVSETVEVTAAAPPLQSDRADTSSELTTVQTANLPVGTNRNFQALLNLVPGTTRASFQHSQFFNAASSLQTEVNGQPRQGNNYQIEGIDDNERTGLLQILVPPIEAIQTVNVSTSNFDAELGRAIGAVTNVILKSGTNEIHGAAYEFLRNSAFNARNFFDPSVGHLAYNYFGGNVGGPIIKNKLFYFGDILRVTDHQANTNLLTIPTLQQRSGDLSGSTTPIYDPFSGNADGTGRVQFPGNVIPANRINPISAKLMSLLPAPNVASTTGNNNFFALLPFYKNTTSYDIKTDWNVTDQDRLTARFSYSRPLVFQAPVFGTLLGGPAQGAFEGTGIQRTYSSGLNYTRVFSPNLISEFRFGVAYYNNIATNSDFGTTSSQDLGIPGINLDPITSGIVGINLSTFYSNNIIGYSASVPWVRAEANIDFANTWTKTLGNHTIKWGGDVRRVRDALFQMQTFSPRGVYTFSGGQTALNTGTATAPRATNTSYYNNFASFLLDVPSQAGRDLPTYFPNTRWWQIFMFVQDKWVVTPKLTVDLGLRYELYPPAKGATSGALSNYNPSNNTLEIAGVGSIPDDLGVRNNFKNFAPRIGAAYRFNTSTVVRAGFGISYTPFLDNTYAYNYPVRANVQYDPVGITSSFTPAIIRETGQPAYFQNGFPAPTLPSVPSSGVLAAPLSQAYFVVDPNFKNPYIEAWNFAIQRALPWHFVLDVAYVGNHGVGGSNVQYNLNAATVTGLGTNGQPLFQQFGKTANVTKFWGRYSNRYNALQVKFDRRMAGFTMTTSYTYGKGMGYQNGDDGGLTFYINQRRNYARNDYDRTHTFVQSYVYDLPFGKGHRWLNNGIASRIIGGWRVNGILTLMSGTPLTLTASGTSLAAPGNTQTVDQVAPVNILNGIGANSAWFDPKSFAQPTATGVFGNTGRNIFSGPGFFNLDASIFKVFRFTERYNLEVRGEAFSVTNTPQFSNPGTSFTSANFGYVTGAGGARGLQLGMKFNF